MRSFSSNLATLWLMYSLPLSEWKPSIWNGNCSITIASAGNKNASLMPCTQACTCHWLTASTQVM
jgi:hypothetical protein